MPSRNHTAGNSYPIWIASLAVALGICLCSTPASAADTNEILAAATEAYSEGNYRRAAEQLNELSRQAEQLAPDEKLIYWDISANVTEASGLFTDAHAAANKYLALLQATSASASELSLTEKNALVRLARIKSALAGQQQSEHAEPQPTSPLLSESIALLRKALTPSQAEQQARPLWEAETRLLLGRTLEKLGQSQDAANEYIAASRLAASAAASLEITDDSAHEFDRAIVVIRQATPANDQAASRRQASIALPLIESRLNSNAISRPLRGKLLVARAECIRQLEDTALEKQLLAEASNTPEFELLSRAKVLVRLAELADRDAALRDRDLLRQQANNYYAQAVEVYDRLLQTAKSDAQSPDLKKRAASRTTQAECLMQLQLIHTRLADWPHAIQAAERLLALRRDSLLAHSDPNYFRTLASLGALHAKKARSAYLSAGGEGRDLSAARADGRKAQNYLKPACDFWREYKPLSAAELATALNHRAEALRYDGEFRQADELLRVAEPHCRSAYAADDLRLGEYYSNHAAVQAALGLYALALDNYDAAITAADIHDATDIRERRRLLAMIYLNKAQLHKSQRQLADARTMCDQAAEAAREAGLTASDLVPFELARASLLIAEAEQNYARSKQNNGEPASAGGNEAQSTPPDYEYAVQQNLTEAAQITGTQLANSQASSPLQLATAHHLNALAHYRLFELCGADESVLRSAEDAWKEIAQPRAAQGEPGIDILRVRALNHIAALALRDVAASRAKALAASRREDVDANFVNVLAKHAEARLQEADSASRYAEELAKSMVAYPAVRAQALFGRAQVLNATARIHRAKARRSNDSDAADTAPAAPHDRLAQEKTAAAIQALRAALEIIELPRAMTVGAEEERAEYLAQFAPAFDLLVDLLMEQGRFVEAIQEAEKRRSRTFQDQLTASGVDMYATASKHHVARAQKLRDEYYSTLDALRKNWNDADRRAALSKTLDTLQREFVAAERAVKSSSRAARQLLVETASTKNVSSEAPPQAESWVRDFLGDEDVALVYYIGAERSYVVACGQGLGVHGHALTVTAEQAHRRGLWMPPSVANQPVASRPLRADDVKKIVHEVRAWAERPLRNAENENIDLQRGPGGLRETVAAKIGPEHLFIATEILLPAELRKKLIAAQPAYLVIVPDGALHQLPFELLPTDADRSKYLLDELPPMCYAPSLHIHRTLGNQPAETTSHITLLSVADPDYNVSKSSLTATARDLTSVGQEFHHYWDGRLARLESAAEEFAEVTAAFKELGDQRVTILPLTNANATEERLTESLRERPVSILHIAAHGLVTQRHNNLFGALALTTQPHPTAADDGFVALHEVFNLPLSGCDLAVLSACQTNCGPESPLEAGSTLARAFLCAGARRVVSSHWSVSDKATAPLIGGFMHNVARNLRNGDTVDYATALHAAKKRLRNEPQTAVPYFWAPFVLIGPPSDARSTAANDSLATQ